MSRPSGISLFALALVSASVAIFSPKVDAFISSAPTFVPSMPLPLPTAASKSNAQSLLHASANDGIISEHSHSRTDDDEENENNNSSPGEPSTMNSHRILDRRRRHWINRSLKYYTTVAREQKRRSRGQLPPTFPRSSPGELQTQIRQAERHYFARNLIHRGKLDHAEALYRRIIDEIRSDEDGCDHARLAVSTLLLALLKQRMGDVKGARSVFLHFFRTVVEQYPEGTECACSAKVLQAYALFEMKRGHGRKSFQIVERAVELDDELRPVLGWWQFRDVKAAM